MMLLAAVLIAGDAWTWDVTLQTNDAEGVLTTDRERWTFRIGKESKLTAERRYLGTIVSGDTFVPAPDSSRERLDGTVETDGTLSVKGEWSDPNSMKSLLRLINPDKTLANRLPGWNVLQGAFLTDSKARLPGSGIPVRLTVKVILTSARLGGRDIVLLPKAKE